MLYHSRRSHASDGSCEILALDGVSGAELDALGGQFRVAHAPRLSEAQSVEQVRALIVRNETRVDRPALQRLPLLEIVARAGVGLDNLDLRALCDSGIVVTNAPGANAVSTAEHTLALALAAVRRIPQLDREVRGGSWTRRPGRELTGDRWGVVGFGRVGRRVSKIAAALGMTVLASDPAVDQHVALGPAVELVPLERLLRESLVVSLHVPLTSDTHPLIGVDELAIMRRDAVLVNTARGGVVDERALADALRKGLLAAAALDVREHEPPIAPDPLTELEQVILTPHVAALTPEAQARVLESVARDVRNVLTGKPAQNAVNFPRPRRGERGGAVNDRPRLPRSE